MAVLKLERVSVPGDPGFTGLEVSAGELVARRLAPDQGAALLRAVAGLRDRGGDGVRVGRVLVDGTSVNRKGPHKRGIGYVPAGGGLLPQLTVWDNILDGADEEEIPRDTAENRAERLAESLDLTASLTLLPHELLGHEERLRVALARAAMRDPGVRVLHLAPSPELPDAPGALTVIDAGDLRRLLEEALPREGRVPATLVLTDRHDVCQELGPARPRATEPVAAGGR